MTDNYRFILDGETPAKKNNKQIFRNSKTGKTFIACSSRFAQWHIKAKLQITEQLKICPVHGINKPCIIELKFTHGDLRRRDSDNGTSSVLDLLTDCGIIEDDNWQIVNKLIVENCYEKGNAQCLINIIVL